jgi:hypothetical protein
MVHLDEQREAAVLQPFDDGAFPRRAAQIHRRALQPADQLAQFALAAWPGQRSVAHVVLQVDILVLDPLGHRVQAEGVLQPPVPRRGEAAVGAKVAHQQSQEIARCAFGQLEDQ